MYLYSFTHTAVTTSKKSLHAYCISSIIWLSLWNSQYRVLGAPPDEYFRKAPYGPATFLGSFFPKVRDHQSDFLPHNNLEDQEGFSDSFSWTMAFRRPWCFVDVLAFMWTCRWSTCYALAAGRCMYSWVGWDWAGHVLTVMWTCRWRTCYAVAAGSCMDNNVHGSLCHRFCYATLCSLELCTNGDVMVYCIFCWTLHSCVMLRYCMFFWTLHSCVMLRYCLFSWTLRSCVMLRYCMFSGILRSFVMLPYTHCHATLLFVFLNFALTRHATLSNVLLNFALMGHATLSNVPVNFALMRHATLSYVLLNFALMRHATLLYVLLNFPLMRFATLSYVLLNFALMCHATLLYVFLNFALMCHVTHPSVTQYAFMWFWCWSLQSPDPQRFLEELEALLWPKDENMWRRISFRLAWKPKNGSVV